jgi:hypothetical protein
MKERGIYFHGASEAYIPPDTAITGAAGASTILSPHFTIESWVRLKAGPGSAVICGKYNAGTGQPMLELTYENYGLFKGV